MVHKYLENLWVSQNKIFERLFNQLEMIKENMDNKALCMSLSLMKSMPFAGKEDLIALQSVILFFIKDSKDAVVNQLLTNLDGVEALNNVIVIGMTNRKDLLD